MKKLFLKISRNSEEHTCARVSFLIKLRPQAIKRLWHRCFPLNFAKFSRTSFLQNTSGRLVLNKINKLHERGLRIIYNDKKSNFEELLGKDNSVSIHHRNLRMGDHKK